MITGPLRIVLASAAILLCGIGGPAHSQLTRTQERILRIVIDVDGHLTQEMHRQFWADWPKVDRTRKAKSSRWLVDSMLVAQRYQRALWDSALRSYQSRRIVRTKGLIAAERAADERARNPPYAPGSPGWKGFQEAYVERMAVAKENASRLLAAASKRAPLRAVQGHVVPIDERHIRHVLARLDVTYRRLERLVDPVWRGG